jgi:hypothetical protein
MHPCLLPQPQTLYTRFHNYPKSYISPELVEIILECTDHEEFDSVYSAIDLFRGDVFGLGLVLLEMGTLVEEDNWYTEELSLKRDLLEVKLNMLRERYSWRLIHLVETMLSSIRIRPDWIGLLRLTKDSRDETQVYQRLLGLSQDRGGDTIESRVGNEDPQELYSHDVKDNLKEPGQPQRQGMFSRQGSVHDQYGILDKKDSDDFKTNKEYLDQRDEADISVSEDNYGSCRVKKWRDRGCDNRKMSSKKSEQNSLEVSVDELAEPKLSTTTLGRKRKSPPRLPSTTPYDEPVRCFDKDLYPVFTNHENWPLKHEKPVLPMPLEDQTLKRDMKEAPFGPMAQSQDVAAGNLDTKIIPGQNTNPYLRDTTVQKENPLMMHLGQPTQNLSPRSAVPTTRIYYPANGTPYYLPSTSTLTTTITTTQPTITTVAPSSSNYIPIQIQPSTPSNYTVYNGQTRQPSQSTLQPSTYPSGTTVTTYYQGQPTTTTYYTQGNSTQPIRISSTSTLLPSQQQNGTTPTAGLRQVPSAQSLPTQPSQPIQANTTPTSTQQNQSTQQQSSQPQQQPAQDRSQPSSNSLWPPPYGPLSATNPSLAPAVSTPTKQQQVAQQQRADGQIPSVPQAGTDTSRLMRFYDTPPNKNGDAHPIDGFRGFDSFRPNVNEDRGTGMFGTASSETDGTDQKDNLFKQPNPPAKLPEPSFNTRERSQSPTLVSVKRYVIKDGQRVLLSEESYPNGMPSSGSVLPPTNTTPTATVRNQLPPQTTPTPQPAFPFGSSAYTLQPSNGTLNGGSSTPTLPPQTAPPPFPSLPPTATITNPRPVQPRSPSPTPSSPPRNPNPPPFIPPTQLLPASMLNPNHKVYSLHDLYRSTPAHPAHSDGEFFKVAKEIKDKLDELIEREKRREEMMAKGNCEESIVVGRGGSGVTKGDGVRPDEAGEMSEKFGSGRHVRQVDLGKVQCCAECKRHELQRNKELMTCLHKHVQPGTPSTIHTQRARDQSPRVISIDVRTNKSLSKDRTTRVSTSRSKSPAPKCSHFNTTAGICPRYLRTLQNETRNNYSPTRVLTPLPQDEAALDHLRHNLKRKANVKNIEAELVSVDKLNKLRDKLKEQKARQMQRSSSRNHILKDINTNIDDSYNIKPKVLALNKNSSSKLLATHDQDDTQKEIVQKQMNDWIDKLNEETARMKVPNIDGMIGGSKYVMKA